ncbi:hypothetical protein SANTM175S_09731 [Streptomyces antimycoticus]
MCNKRTTESLIKAGAFDGMGHTRKGLTAHYEVLIDNVVAVKRKEAEGQFDLFGGMAGEGGDGEGPGFGLDVEFSDVEWEKTYLLAQEREMLGLDVSDHPLFGIEQVLNEKADAAISALTGGEHADGAIVTIGGIISGLQRKMTKQGNAWAIATVEDLAGSIECMFFPATYQLVSTQLVEDAVVFVKGRLDKREDVPRLVAMELMVPDLSEASANAPVTITIPTVKVTPPLVEKLGEVLTHHRGATEVRIKLQGARKTTVLRLDRHRVTACRPGALRRSQGAVGGVLPGRMTARRRDRRARPLCDPGGLLARDRPPLGRGARPDGRLGDIRRILTPAAGCAPGDGKGAARRTRPRRRACGAPRDVLRPRRNPRWHRHDRAAEPARPVILRSVPEGPEDGSGCLGAYPHSS